MVKNIRARLLRLARRDYRPNAWRRQDDVGVLLSQFCEEFRQLSQRHQRWIPYSMPAVDAVREALEDGTIPAALVPLVIRNAYLRAFERDRPRVTRSMVRAAINEELHRAA